MKFKTMILSSSLCYYSDAYLLVKGTLIVENTAVTPASSNNGNAKVIFKTYAPFTSCISGTIQK